MKLSIAILSSVIAMVSASAVTVTTASTMQVVMDNFAKAQNHFSKINDLVNEFPQNGAKVASEIHNQESGMQAAISKVTANLQILSKPVSGDNVQKIIGAFQTIMPSATQSLNQISAKAADFSALGATTTTQLKNDLVVSGNLCLQLQNDINSIAPPAMADTLTPAITDVTAASEAAIAALS